MWFPILWGGRREFEPDVFILFCSSQTTCFPPEPLVFWHGWALVFWWTNGWINGAISRVWGIKQRLAVVLVAGQVCNEETVPAPEHFNSEVRDNGHALGHVVTMCCITWPLLVLLECHLWQRSQWFCSPIVFVVIFFLAILSSKCFSKLQIGQSQSQILLTLSEMEQTSSDALKPSSCRAQWKGSWACLVLAELSS